MSNVANIYNDYDQKGRIWGEVPRDRVKALDFPRVSEKIRQAYLGLKDLSTGVSDCLDKYGICGAIAQSHLPNLIPGKRIAGTAVTSNARNSRGSIPMLP